MVAWRRVAGEALRGCAVPFRLYRKTLIVAVPDTAWQKQMEAMSGQLIFRLNSLFGQAAITFIEFRIDPKTVQAERARLKVAVVDRKAQERRALECAAELRGAAASIRDADLRRRFCSPPAVAWMLNTQKVVSFGVSVFNDIALTDALKLKTNMPITEYDIEKSPSSRTSKSPTRSGAR